jgi:hypothetical protein
MTGVCKCASYPDQSHPPVSQLDCLMFKQPRDGGGEQER